MAKGKTTDAELSERNLAAPRKLILLVRTTQKGTYEATDLNGEVVIAGATRDEIKEKMRAQVKAMDSHVRPTTVRLHFLDDARMWTMASGVGSSDGDESGGDNHSNKADEPADKKSRSSKK